MALPASPEAELQVELKIVPAEINGVKPGEIELKLTDCLTELCLARADPDDVIEFAMDWAIDCDAPSAITSL